MTSKPRTNKPRTNKPKRDPLSAYRNAKTDSLTKKGYAAAKPPSRPISDTEYLERAWQESRSKNFTPPHELPEGIHFGVSFEDYLRIPAINASSLRLAKKSLAHYRYAAPMEDKPYFRLGSLIHCGKLEPAELEKRYVVLPDKEIVERVQQSRIAEGLPPYDSPKATKMYKEAVRQFMALHPDKQEVSTAWFEDMQGVLRSLESNPASKTLFERGHPEVTLIARDPETGLLLKGRTDFISTSGECLVDIKTSDDIFRWSLDKYDYHLQAAFYEHVYRLARDKSDPKLQDLPKFNQLPFWFVVVEKSRPWTTIAAPISSDALEVGTQEFEFLLDKLSEAINNKAYPKVDHVTQWDLSVWHRPMHFPLALADAQGTLSIAEVEWTPYGPE